MGEGLNFLIPAPVPASIYAMVILFVCLCTKVNAYTFVYKGCKA